MRPKEAAARPRGGLAGLSSPFTGQATNTDRVVFVTQRHWQPDDDDLDDAMIEE